MSGCRAAGLAILLSSCAVSQGEEPVTRPASTEIRTHTSRPPEQTAASTTACDRGDLPACHAAALDAYYAPSSPETSARARQLFERACEAGYAPSCNGLGTLYEQGRGVPRDPAAAVALYRRACLGDASTGCQHLAQALRGGHGIAKDEAAAARADARASCLAGAADVAACPSLDATTAFDARIRKIDIVGSDTLVTVAAGRAHGVTMAWTGCVLRGSTCDATGTLTLVRVDERSTIAKVPAVHPRPGTGHVRLVPPP